MPNIRYAHFQETLSKESVKSSSDKEDTNDTEDLGDLSFHRNFSMSSNIRKQLKEIFF